MANEGRAEIGPPFVNLGTWANNVHTYIKNFNCKYTHFMPGPQYYLKQALESEWNALVESVIREVRSLPKSWRQSGEDSPLFDLWEEYKSQIQFQESVFFDLYVETIELICQGEVKKLSFAACVGLWSMIDDFEDWEEEFEEEPGPVDFGRVRNALTSHLMERVNQVAVDEEIVTLDEALLEIAPFTAFMDSLGDPYSFFADAAEYAYCPADQREAKADSLVGDFRLELEENDFPFKGTDEEVDELLKMDLVNFFTEWNRLATQKFGRR